MRGDRLMSNTPRMLEGYRVLDFTQFVAGPTCTRLLGEMGAEVIKVELAPAGDRVRADGLKSRAPEFEGSSHSTYYLQHNHSKLSFAIDLKKPGAREIVMSIIPQVDVVVENFAPRVIDGSDLLTRMSRRSIRKSSCARSRWRDRPGRSR